MNLQGSGDGDEVGQPSDIDGEEEFLADCEFGDWTQFQASAHNAGAPVVSQDESENSGAYFLEKIDPDFVCGPRGIVRGEYSGVLNGQKIVIDRSMTVLKQLSKNVIFRSIAIFSSTRNWLSQKIVIDLSMTVSGVNTVDQGAPLQNCH